jgi:uncharacterized membrane protein YdbT with pleckstrin-like domain
MLYVQQSLAPDEELVHIGRFHWMYTVSAALWIFFGIVGTVVILVAAAYIDIYTNLNNLYSITEMPKEAFNMAWAQYVEEKGGYLDIVRSSHPAVRVGAFLSFLAGLYMFAQMMVIKATTEIAITNNRLIYKQGLIARHVGEISIDRIEGVNVLQGIFGRMFGYGNVIVRGMGVGEVLLPPIAEPIDFRKAIEKARTL